MRTFVLNSKQVVRYNKHSTKPSDPYYTSEYRLRPDMEIWIRNLKMPFQWKAGYGVHRIIFDNPKDAMLFKLTWM